MTAATRPRRGAALRFLLLIALALPGVAAAQGDAHARDYARAAQLRASDPEGALAVYRALLAETGAPRARAQVGLLEGQLGRWLAAEESLASALEARGDAWVEPRRATLEATLAQVRAHLSELTVVANVPGATLAVNGAAAGRLPLARGVRVAVGAVVIDLDAEGHEHLRQSVEVVPGQTRVAVELVPVRVAPPVLPPPRALEAPRAEAPRAEGPRGGVAPGVTSRWWFWTGLGVLVAGGVVVGLAAGGVFNTVQPPQAGTAYDVSALRW